MRCACPPNLGSSLASAVSEYSRTAAEALGRCEREWAGGDSGEKVWYVSSPPARRAHNARQPTDAAKRAPRLPRPIPAVPHNRTGAHLQHHLQQAHHLGLAGGHRLLPLQQLPALAARQQLAVLACSSGPGQQGCERSQLQPAGRCRRGDMQTLQASSNNSATRHQAGHGGKLLLGINAPRHQVATMSRLGCAAARLAVRARYEARAAYACSCAALTTSRMRARQASSFTYAPACTSTCDRGWGREDSRQRVGSGDSRQGLALCRSSLHSNPRAVGLQAWQPPHGFQHCHTNTPSHGALPSH